MMIMYSKAKRKFKGSTAVKCQTVQYYIKVELQMQARYAHLSDLAAQQEFQQKFQRR
jgi:hypothetical protein